MEAEEVKQGNEKSLQSSVVIEVKNDVGTEMGCCKDNNKNENCQSSETCDEAKEGKINIDDDGKSSTSGESWRENELKMCRICHMGNWESNESELIQLGCGCKNELGASHLTCAQTWFKLKGSRLCEICGKNALNVSGVEERNTDRDTNSENASVVLVVEWDEMRRFRNSIIAGAPAGGMIIPNNHQQQQQHCQRTCRNVVLLCLVLAFIVPWLFRINLF